MTERRAGDEGELGLVWPGRAPLEVVRARLAAPVECSLERDAARSRGGPGEAASRHRFVVGDNLAALRALRPTLEGRVALAYLDPPYNTGHAFAYDDAFAESRAEHRARTGRLGDARTRRHARWLDALVPRLALVHALLAPEGLVAVSIDDHEVHHLRVVLDEIFGDDAFVAQLVVAMNPKGRQLGAHFATSHEYVVVYARDRRRVALDPTSAEAVRAADFPRVEGEVRYRLLPLRNTNKAFHPGTRPTLAYPLHVEPSDGSVRTEPSASSLEVWPRFGDGSPAVWRWSRAKVEATRHALVGRQIEGRLGVRWDVFQRDELHAGRRKKLTTVWTHDAIGSSDEARAELEARVGRGFETPKPLRLLARLVALVPRDALVLDPYAGSGTTGEAVYRANALDGGTRTFVGVEAEPAIAELALRRLEAAAAALARSCAEADASDRGLEVACVSPTPDAW